MNPRIANSISRQIKAVLGDIAAFEISGEIIPRIRATVMRTIGDLFLFAKMIDGLLTENFLFGASL